MLSKFFNPALITKSYWGTGFQPVSLVKGKYFVHAQQTACSDHITDMLMYPSIKMDSIRYKGTINRKRKQRYMFSFIGAEQRKLVLDNLKYLRMIEQANNLKPTKITCIGNFNLFAEPDREISRTTFNLSWFLKFFRIAQTTGVPSFIFTFGEFSSWLLFSGKLHLVDKDSKFVHGWRNPKQGSHSNNGAVYTNWAVEKLSKYIKDPVLIPIYERNGMERVYNDFVRGLDLLPVYKEFLSNKKDNLKVIPQ